MSYHGKKKIRFVLHKGLKEIDESTGMPHLCKYHDDIAILMGHHILYVNRHIKRAYNEALDIILSLPEFRLYKKFIEL